MYGPPSDATLRALPDKDLVAALVGAASDGNEYDNRSTTEAYCQEVLRRLRALLAAKERR